MAEAEETFGVLLKQLPNQTEVPDLLIDITQAGLARGLEFDRFEPQDVVNQDFYAEMPVSIIVTGTYHQIGEFVSDIAALPRIVSVDTFRLSRGDADSGELRMEAVTKTYHYLEE
jgi:type IV pilus assembly protein PilO